MSSMTTAGNHNEPFQNISDSTTHISYKADNAFS